MDFLDPKKRQSHRRRLYIGYALMATLVGIVSILMLFQAYGYSFDLESGDITQNSLLFVDAKPLPANVYINDQLKGQTDQRLILPEGAYSIRLSREGYRDWNRNVFLEGGIINRYLHPFLFPAELETAETQLFSAAPAFATQSPSRQWLLVQVPGSLTSFDVIDLNSEAVATTRIEFPAELFVRNGAKHQLELVEWSTDNEHVVVKHVHDGGEEYILLNHVEPSASVNLSKTFTAAPFTALRLRDKLFDRYYLYNKPTETLATASLTDTSSQVVLTNVLAFQPHGDNEVLYISDENSDGKEVEARMLEDGQSYTIKELPVGEVYLLDVARYSGKWFMAIYSSSDDQMYIMRDPVTFLRRDSQAPIIPAGTLIIEDATHVAFSQNTRFVSAQSGSKLAVYDAEEDDIYRYDTQLKLEAGQKFTWMDGHRLTVIEDGQQVVMDYDGKNVQRLSAGYAQFQPFFDRDYTAIYTLAPSLTVSNRAALIRTDLLVETP